MISQSRPEFVVTLRMGLLCWVCHSGNSGGMEEWRQNSNTKRSRLDTVTA